MTADETKQQIKSRLADYLETITQSRGNSLYNCPICGSGTGQGANSSGKKTPAFSIMPNGEIWKCFSCQETGDIFHLVALLHNLDIKTQFPEILSIAAAALNMPLDTQYTAHTHNTQHTHKADNTGKAGKMQDTAKAAAGQSEPQRKKNFKEYIEQCHAAAGKTDFFQRRGITPESVDRFNLGYDETKKIAVIPYDRNGAYYIGRNVAIDADASGNYKHIKPKTAEAGTEPIYNRAALDHAAAEGQPVFICEAPIDAISIMQAGGVAVAIGGTGKNKLIKYLDDILGKTDFTAPLIIATDTDEPGRKAAAEIAADLESRNLVYTYLEYPESGGKMDANSFLMADAEQFKAAVQAAQDNALAAIQAKAAQNAAEYNKKSAAARLDSFIAKWDTGHGAAIATGFSALDKILDGGLFAGLYAIGAISSLGKTTFTLQIADQIAAAGKDVLFFSLEMAADELTAKTLSRLTAQISQEQKEDYKHAQTNRALTNPERRQFWKQTSSAAIVTRAQERYKEFAQNIFIVEGLGDISAQTIRKAVQEHKRAREKTPVIIVDYVQIMDAYGERLTDKQNMDRNIVELKRISRDYNTPVIAISSFNRDNYTSAVNMAAFKESGAIEYTSDVVIALQPQGMKTGETDKVKGENRQKIDACKADTLRKLEAVILKNRNGGIGAVNFEYNALFNLYTDKGEKPKEQQQIARKEF